MDDTELNSSARIDRLDGLREALQPVHAGDEDVLHASILQFSHHLQPELGALGLGDPQAQHFLLTGQVDANGQVDRLDPVVVSLLYQPEPPGNRPAMKQVAMDESVMQKLVELASFDALAATILLARQSEAIASAALREQALAAYRLLQPTVTSLPEVAPFYGEIYALADQRCKEWLFVTPNQRVELMFFWEGFRDHVWGEASPQGIVDEAIGLVRKIEADTGGVDEGER